MEPVAAAPPPRIEPVATEASNEEDNRSGESLLVDDEEEGSEGTPDEFPITSPTHVRELAALAVESQLNPLHKWRVSPVLPASWPPEGEYVLVYYYPMMADPHDMSRFEVYTPEFRVEVSLSDGRTKVDHIKSRKRLGTIREVRPTRLERDELIVAERGLVKVMLQRETHSGENVFWGYLKFIHEHPKFASDLRRRSPKFMRWVENKGRP